MTSPERSPLIATDANGTVVVTFTRPAEGWPTLEQLIARSKALGVDLFGQPSDEEMYGPWCMFCGNRAAVCRCSDD